MDDRFDRTRREAEAAIDRAKARESIARGRRREVEERIVELDSPHPPHRLRSEEANLAEARDRVAQARASLARARKRAEEAAARRQTG